MTTSATGISWNLQDLFAGFDDPKIKTTLDECAAQAESFAATYRGTINVPGGPQPSHIVTGLQQLEAIYDLLALPSVYAGLLFAADTSKPEHRELQQQVEQRWTAINNQLIFFDLEWLKLSDEDVQRILDDPIVATYRHYLQSSRRYQPHTLSEPEEQVINEKDITGKQAWQQFFTELTSSFTFPFEYEGTTQHLTLDGILAKTRHADRSVRQQAHTTLYDVLKQHTQSLTFIYNTLIQDQLIMDRLRHYPNPMAMRHLSNQIAPETIETMMQVVEQNHDIAHTYFTFKARLLNLPKLQIYDQYAPITQEQPVISYDEAKTMVLQSFGAFDNDFQEAARRFFDEQWIDAEIRPGKRGGAFCNGYPPSKHPYVLCNYTDNLRDVMTIAHELGHGIHFLLANKQTLFNYYPTLPLAETASVFGEMLVFEHLLKQQHDQQAKLGLVCGKIEDIFATIFRQNVLTRFEQKTFAGRSQNRLTPEQISEYWLQTNARYYGDAVELTAGYELGWSYIPHFIHTPFYCYSYVFGELLVLALYDMYREQGASFIPRYKALLASGGSQSPEQLLVALDIDTRDPAFWQRGLNELRRLVTWVQAMVV